MLSDPLVNSCKNCPVAWKNFKNLSESEIRLVNENRYEASFKPGEILIKQGSPASSAIFLSKGMAKAYVEGPDRNNNILDIVLPSSLIISPGLQIDERYAFSVAALTSVQTCFISFKIINQLIRDNPAFATGMIEDLSMKSLVAHKKLVSLTQKKMAGRIAEALLFFSDEVYHSDTFDVILTRQELGELTNMAKESVVRILKELDSQGVIKSDSSRIQILDMSRLHLISEKG